MTENEKRIKELETENKILKEQLEETNNNYKKLSMELGQIVFQNEDYEYEITQLKREIEKLEEENKKLKEFKEEVENSKAWKVKSIFK